MGGQRMFSLALLIAVGLASGSPCTTVGPAPAPPPPAASPCVTVAPVPATTCSSYACSGSYLPKAGVILCGNADGPKCDTTTCCNLVTTVTTTPYTTVTTTPGTTVTTTPGTTVTTTPAPTCGSFTCPEGFKTSGKSVVCAGGSCNKATCCKALPPPCTTVTTTPAPTCASFTCPSGYSANKATTVCGMGKCNTATCCAVIVTTVTTTPCTTTTPAPPVTCASSGFSCASAYTANAGSTVCATGKCNTATCCAIIITTVTTTPAPTPAPAPPASPCGTVAPAPPAPAPPAPSSPCGTVAPRLYEAKEAELVQQLAQPKNEASAVPVWAFPVFSLAAMFSFVAFVVRPRDTRSARQTRVVEPVLQEEHLLGEEDEPVE